MEDSSPAIFPESPDKVAFTLSTSPLIPDEVDWLSALAALISSSNPLIAFYKVAYYD